MNLPNFRCIYLVIYLYIGLYIGLYILYIFVQVVRRARAVNTQRVNVGPAG